MVNGADAASIDITKLLTNTGVTNIIASIIPEANLNDDYVTPNPFNSKVVDADSRAVSDAAVITE